MNVYGRYALDVFKRFLLKDGTDEEKLIEIKIELNSISGFNLYPLNLSGKLPLKLILIMSSTFSLEKTASNFTEYS